MIGKNVELRGCLIGREIKESGDVLELRNVFGSNFMSGADKFIVILFKTNLGNIYELARRPDSVVDLYLRGIRPFNPDFNPDQRGVTLINMKGSLREERLNILPLDEEGLDSQELRIGEPFDYRYMGGWQGKTEPLSEIVVTNMRMYAPFVRAAYTYNKIVDELLQSLSRFKEIPDSTI